MRAIAVAGALFALTSAPAFAQTTPDGQVQTNVHPAQTQTGFAFGGKKCHGPINVSSDSFEGDLQTKVGTYISNVIVIQAECRLRADKVIAEATQKNDLNKLTAVGHVVFTSSTGTAVGDNGVYDLVAKTITLTGKVVLTKGKDVMKGTHLVVDTDTGLAHLTAKGMTGGRVQSIFVPKSEHEDAPKKPKSNATN